MSGKGSLTSKAVRLVSPALEKYSEDTLLKDVWKRPDLSPRDRSIVTVAALIARNQAIEMPTQFTFALDNGVKPNEISEIITHLAFYSGWGNALSAIAVGIRTQQKFSATVESRWINFHRLLVNTFLSMRLLKPNVQPVLNRMPAQWLRELCITRASCFSVTFGYVRP